MNHKEKLLEIYNNSFSINDIEINTEIKNHVDVIGKNIESQKGVYTVLITLGVHKLLFPNQDIRYHQDNMEGGFSGRSIDTKFITPTLKNLGLTSMSESGWLTRSLEQPYPYNWDYNGKISNRKVKNSFLFIVDFYETKSLLLVRNILRTLLNYSIIIREKNKVEIKPISNPDTVTIEKVINSLTNLFGETFHISGGSKLPVLSFYSIYSILIKEIKRFDGCELKELGFHTTSDKTSKSSGDIEVFRGDDLIESLEIKYDIDIDSHIVNRVIEKIYKYNPKRYYVLSTGGINQEDYLKIISKVHELKNVHGCQLIINGLVPTLKYYLRLISDVQEFVNTFSQLVISDKELKIIHKTKWKEIYEEEFK